MGGAAEESFDGHGKQQVEECRRGRAVELDGTASKPSEERRLGRCIALAEARAMSLEPKVDRP
jgi:hypothetical protein